MAGLIRDLFVIHVGIVNASQPGRRGTWGDSHLPSRDGGQDRRGKVHPSVWEKIARSCLEHGLDPSALVAAHFETTHVLKGLPRPGALVGEAALRRYGDYVRDCSGRMRLAWDVQLEDLEIQSYRRERSYREEPEDAAFRVLASPHSQMSGLFRYCIASTGKCGELMARFRPMALEQYLSGRYAYDLGWGDLIPAELRAEADKWFEERT